ncbi:hypothetical protein RHAB15C_0000662 [Candidatus Rhabdochlamydia porcellionis]|jgi:hypothetical protein|uniref:Uncharacterized protein n=1 Tax=Candidatus Rhabdochlamydia porcellionis TaxID=225148 RepID=A0ABX8Z061_9BACT|nr:hypothetical protein RHAB15C_0000662 [Candidatus Rhabdochlamydia porcellionis]
MTFLSFALKIHEIESCTVWLSWIIPIVLAAIGIWRSRVEKIKISFFYRVDRYLAWALFGGAAVSVILFFIRIWFKNMEMMDFVEGKKTHFHIFLPTMFYLFF